VDFTGVPRYDPIKFLGYIGSCVDMTEQKLADEIPAGGASLAQRHSAGQRPGDLAGQRAERSGYSVFRDG
jgi:hypothetical protein